MKQLLKVWLTFLVRALLTPWRVAKRRKYADPDREKVVRKEFDNERFLPLVSQYTMKGETAVIFVNGYSMRPFLEHLRDRVKLAPWKELHVGDAILAEITPGHFVLHRIIDIQNKRDITLMGDGNTGGTEHCTMDDVRGLVIEYIRPAGHVLQASDPKLKFQIRLWRRLLPIRRYLLFLYKATL